MFRTIMNQVLRQTAEQKIQQAAEERKRGAMYARIAAGRPEPEDELPPPADVAVLFALDFESADYVESLGSAEYIRCPSFSQYTAEIEGRRIVAVETGVGVDRAAQATGDVISIHRPKWIVSAGFAGGLRAGLRRGHILMADAIKHETGPNLSVGLNMDPETVAASKGMHVGGLLTVSHIIARPAEKQALGEKFDALACDMESYAIATVCSKLKTRFVSVRVISDTVDDELPRELEHLVKQHSLAGKLGAAAGAIFQRPSSVKDMWNLKEQAYLAAERLAKFLPGVIDQLAPPKKDVDAGE